MKQFRLSRLAALTGAIALAGACAFSGAGTAYADAIDGNATGSLTVHKHVEDSASTDGNPAGAPLEGVEFTISQVLVDPDGSGPEVAAPIDMTTAEGWGYAEQVYASAAPDLPAGDATNGPVFSLGTETVQTTAADGTAVFSNLDLGAYLVTETGSGDNLISEAAAPFWVSVPMPSDDGTWIYDVDAYPKNVLNDFDPTKEVTSVDPIDPEGNVSWTIYVPIPASELAYESLVISDPATTELDFESFGDVYVGGVLLEAGTDYTISGTTISLTQSGLDTLNVEAVPTEIGSGTTVSVVVNTTVASINASGALVNDATVTLNGITKIASATTNWGELLINKTDEADASLLAGATFELYAEDQTTLIGTGTTDANGELQFDVWVGNDTDTTEDFWLKETVAPAGYVLSADPWTAVTVNAGQATAATVTITNHLATGPTLPMTGGAGTALITVVGIAIIGGAVVVPMIRRKKAAKVAA